MHLQESMIDELAECTPVISRVLNGICERSWSSGKLLLVKPALEVIQDWFSESLPESNAISFRKGDGQAIDFKHAFDHAQGVVGKFFFGFFGIFKIPVDMCPAVCGGGSNSILFDIGEHFVVDGCAVGKQEAEVAWQEFLMIFGGAILGEVVDIVGSYFVAAVDADLTFYCLTGTFADEGHGRFVRFNHLALEDEFLHAA